LAINGEGIAGTINTIPDKLNLENILINMVVDKTVVLLNQSECDMKIGLQCQRIENAHGKRIVKDQKTSKDSQVDLSESSCFISARSSKTIKMYIQLKAPGQYTFELGYYIEDLNNEMKKGLPPHSLKVKLH
jgi:hypothetical protein